MKGLGLDIGCGAAMYKHSVKNFEQFRWVGVDKSDFTRLYKAGEFFIHDVADYLPFANDTFDIIWCHHVLEHLEPIHPHARFSWHIGAQDYVVWVINEMWRVLKPGGEAHIIVPWKEHTNAWRSPTHYRFMDENYFTYFGWQGNKEDHQTCSLWSKWQPTRSEVVDQCHVYGILKALEWKDEEELKATLGPGAKNWKEIDLVTELGRELIKP